MGRADRVGQLARTVAHLPPAQVVHRIRLRARQELLRRWPEPLEARWTPLAGPTPGLPAAFEAVDAVAPPSCGPFEDLAAGTFTFLHETRHLGEPVAWDPPGASQLWLYHQHYWEWAWTLAAHEDRARARDVFERQFRSWRAATRFGRWNAWAPYPASLRAWVLVNCHRPLAEGGAVEGEVVDEIRRHAGFVAHNLELDVGGNHLLKNLKALVGLGVFLADDGLLALAERHLRRQLPRQVLPDGGHFELSPSYHCQVLGDLIDVQRLLAAAGRPAVHGLDGAVSRMRAWLGTVLMPDGDVPLFNDCERVGLRRIAALDPSPAPDEPLIVLADSGYVVVRPGPRLHLVADVGRPCPPELPAHAQADCLSFELAADGARVVIDPGTSVYGSGPQRAFERSTRAHSTVEVDDTDQTEVWGAFRAGRLARPTLHRAGPTADGMVVIASHDGYRHLPGSPVHRRTWTVSADAVRIEDQVTGSGRHRLRHHLLFADDGASGGAAAPGPTAGPAGFEVEVTGPPGAEGRWSAATHAVGFGDLRPARALTTEGDADLPAAFTTTIRVRPVAGAFGPADRPM